MYKRSKRNSEQAGIDNDSENFLNKKRKLKSDDSSNICNTGEIFDPKFIYEKENLSLRNEMLQLDRENFQKIFEKIFGCIINFIFRFI